MNKKPRITYFSQFNKYRCIGYVEAMLCATVLSGVGDTPEQAYEDFISKKIIFIQLAG